MKAYLIALFAAVIFAATLGIAGLRYSWHSTPVFWAVAANMPGLIAATWWGLLTGTEAVLSLLVVTALANWGSYSFFIWAVRMLKRSMKR